MDNLLKKSMIAAGLLAASQTAEVNAAMPTQPTVDDAKEKVALICGKQKSEIHTQTGAKLSTEQLMAKCMNTVSSKETREYLISLGINPQNLPGVTVRERQYESGQFQENMSLSELGIDKENSFTVDNISTKFEQILGTINEKYPIQFIEGDWKNEFKNLSPNEDEVKLLNYLVSILPNEVKPVPLANALTGIIALKKYSEMDISTLSETEKVILNANIQAVLAVSSPELVEKSLDLVLPKGTQIGDKTLQSEKTYTTVSIDREVVQEISKIGVDLPIELVTEMASIHEEYQTILAELKQKADSQDSEKRAQRYMRFHDQYADAFTQMPTTSKIDMLQILSTGNDEGSKLKGQKLLDKASEYISIMDGGFTEENVKKLRIYHKLIAKYNQTGDDVLNDIVLDRLYELKRENGEHQRFIAKTREEISETREEISQIDDRISQTREEISQIDDRIKRKQNNLEELIALRKQMEMLAYNSN